MSNLSQILADSNWGQESARINQNFQNINTDLEKVKSATTKFKGYFTTEESLKNKFGSPKIGDTAWVGESYPGTVYDGQVAGSWHDTGKAPDTGSVDLQDYAKKEELTELETTQSVFPLHTLQNPLKNDNTLDSTPNSRWKTYYKVPAKKGDVFVYKREYDGYLDSSHSYYIVTKTNNEELTRLDGTNSNVTIDLNYEMPEDGFVSVCFNPSKDVVSLKTKELGIYDEIGKTEDSISLNENSIIDSPFLGIYKFGVIGDSLSVGHMTNPINNEVNSRNIQFSWGQILARKNGQKCLNFGFSGATATTWFTNTTYKCSEELSKSENLCQVYIIGLGANGDAGGLGSFSDIDWDNRDNNAQTFYGQYARIIQLIREVAPQAVIFCLTLPYPREDKSKNNAIKQICSDEHVSSNTFIVDLTQYNDILQKYIVGDNEGEAPKTYNKYYYNWHFTAPGYAMCAELIQKAISAVMNQNANNDVMLSVGQIPFGSNNVIE